MQNTPLPNKFKLSPGQAFAISGISALIILTIVGIIFLNDTTSGLVCSAFWAVLFLPLLFRQGRRFLTSSRVGMPEISLSNSSPRSGERIVVNYQHLFKNAADLSQVAIRLILHETSVRGSGTDKTVRKHEFTIREIVIPGRHIEGGETFYSRQDLEIPPGVMHTFKASDNRIEWKIVVKVDFQGLPDLSESMAIQVLPEMASL
jgi:hypothetical protein